MNKPEITSNALTLRLLLVEDSAEDAAQLLTLLERAGYAVSHQRVDAEASLREALIAVWDLVIAEARVHQLNLLDVIGIVHSADPTLPIVVVADTLSLEGTVTAIKAGAGDVLLKNDLTRFLAVVERELQDALSRRVSYYAEQHAQILSNALMQSANLVVITDLTGTIIYVNDAFVRALGYVAAELIGTQVRELCSPQTKDALCDEAFAAVEQGQDWRGEVLNVRRDGSQFWVRMTISPMHDANGLQTHYLIIQEDIGERKRLEDELRRYTEQLEQMVEDRTDELRRAKEQLEVILSHSSDGIVFALATGDIQATNPAFRNLFGDRVERTVEEIVHLLTSPAEVEEIASALVSVLYENRDTRTQARIIQQDGRQIDIDLAFTPVEIEEEKRPGMILSVRDITPLRQAERFKAQFVANAAHDLGNPVATLKTQLYMLKSRPERMSQYIEVIERQTRRLENLITELRTLSDIDRGLVLLELSAVDLNELAASVAGEHNALAGAHSHHLNFRPATNLPIVLLDRNKMVRVIANLITNSIDYTPDGGEITIATYHTIDEIGFTIRDTGIGMTDREQNQAFERFFRSDKAKSLRTDGTGLGLAIVREMVEAHGGAIHVSSVPGKGSEFRVSLPMRRIKQDVSTP
jgi:PAS domain S-box-containing protein